MTICITPREITVKKSDMQQTDADHRESLTPLDIYKSYKKAEFLSVKHSSYFQVYEEVLRRYVGKPITFVEIGILNGGSLFMWRDYFGDEARIIGIDLNPVAKQWESFGFEIYIGDQSDPKFWETFFSNVGKVDVMLDDGGHTNRQQIVTAHSSAPNINDGGVLLVEDVHTSYFTEFGNPSKYSFINFAKRIVDAVNSRFPSVSGTEIDLQRYIYYVTFFESIVCFHIDRRKCFVPSLTRNDGKNLNAEDFRDEATPNKVLISIHARLLSKFRFLKRFKFINKLFECVKVLGARFDSMKMKKYFK
jgi:hypothetical protein